MVDRFSKEERESRDPYAFLPFGAGPRNCLGMRIAMLELKFALAKALQKFRFVTCEKTEVRKRPKILSVHTLTVKQYLCLSRGKKKVRTLASRF